MIKIVAEIKETTVGLYDIYVDDNLILSNWMLPGDVKFEKVEDLKKGFTVKQIITLKEAGFDADDIASLIKNGMVSK